MTVLTDLFNFLRLGPLGALETMDRRLLADVGFSPDFVTAVKTTGVMPSIQRPREVSGHDRHADVEIVLDRKVAKRADAATARGTIDWVDDRRLAA